MDLDSIIFSGRLDGSFPLPADRPFTREDALAAGVTRQHLTLLCREGVLRRPIRSVYVPNALGDSLPLRVACLRLVAPEDCVVVDRHAGWLHGAPMALAPGEHVALRPVSLYRPAGNGRLRNAISSSGERTLSRSDITELDGLRVTTPLRTAWDLGRVRWPKEAIGGLDAMFRLGRFERAEFLAGIERFRGQRWVSTLRAVGPLADGRAESPGESVLRLRCLEVGLDVVPQVNVYADGKLLGRLDLANEDERYGVEYDGQEWHSTREQLARDRRRRDDMRNAGYLIEAFVGDQVFGRGVACDNALYELRRRARERRATVVIS